MVTTRAVEYRVDGMTMFGHLALPDGTDSRPAVLLGHEGIGLNDFQRRRADLLAERGHLALAMDYHGGRWFDDPDERMARLGPLLADPGRMRAIGRAAFDVLLAEPRADPSKVAAVGYGTGGTIALELARDGADLRAVVGVNPVLATVRPEDSARITGQVLVCVGSEDPLAPPEQRLAFEVEMRAAGVDWRLIVYGGAEHAFHHPPVDADGSLSGPDTPRVAVPGVGYHPAHAVRAWRDELAALDEAFGQSA